MEGFNTYIDLLDCSGLTDFFYKKGEKRILKRKEFFLRQNDSSLYAGYVEKGAFRLTRIGDNGKEAVVGYSFEKEFICDYSSFLKRTTSVVNIQATTESVVYVVSLSDYLEYLNTGPEEQRFRHKAAEALFEMVYICLLYTSHIAYHFDCAGQRNAVVSFVESDSGFRVFDKIFCLLRACSR